VREALQPALQASLKPEQQQVLLRLPSAAQARVSAVQPLVWPPLDAEAQADE
jgi:hypothetical protein